MHLKQILYLLFIEVYTLLTNNVSVVLSIYAYTLY
jgi:hypothetical protein